MAAVTLRERGRAFRALRSRWWGWEESRESQIREIVGLQKNADFRRALDESAIPLWTTERAMDAVLAFFAKHNRWPLTDDWTQKNGLPARSTLALLMNTQLRQPWRPAGRQQDRWGWHRQPTRWGKSAWVELQELLVANRTLTAEQVLSLPNVTVRRAAMERFGVARLTRAKNSKLIAKDEYGKLWRFGDEVDYLMLEVINSTPEPDGSFARYYLRVPPTMTCPKQAVAWTFGIEDGWEQYEGGVET